MQNTQFVHLHNHTQYSLLDGALRLEPMLKRAAEYGMPAVSMTDHGNMFGAIEFYRMAKEYNIKPIIGCEVYVAPKSRLERGSKHGISEVSNHLTLLAKNNTGYKNLIKLVTAGFLEGFYYKPRIDKEILAQHSKGLITLSGCWKGNISRLLTRGKIDEAKDAANELRDIMGSDNFYIEMHNQSLEGQDSLNKKLFNLSKTLSIPIAASNDCHYLDKKDAKAHEILLCIQTGKTLSDSNRLKFSSEEFYFKSPEEMCSLFKEIPEAAANTIDIADMCGIDFEFNKIHLPSYDVPSGTGLDEYLNELAANALNKRLRNMHCSSKEIYYQRLKDELAIIKKMGYSGYFLIVWDFIDYAKKEGIPVGPGRGSAAGSLVAYSLGITNLDPIKYGLIFERFLNPERVTMPDIDIDFCMEKRDRVIDYVISKYGKDNVTQIITFGSMLAKGAIRDVGRAMDMPYGEVDKIAKLVPNKLNITLQEAIEEEERLSDLIKKDEKTAQLVNTALTLEGLQRHASTHAAGVVISPLPLTEYLPLYKSPNNNDVTTQFPMGDIERLGLLKMDFLGLKTLTVISNTVKIVKRTRKVDLDIDEIALDDEKTYKLLGSSKTLGVFQLEGSGMRDILRKFKPKNFEDIIAIIALYRPGPLNSGMVEDFIKRKHGAVSVKYELPQLEEILKETYGVIVYQEQVMKIATVLAGFTPGEADLLRRAMGKKKPEEMEQQKEKFMTGVCRNNIPKKKGEKIFDLMAHFAGYGFNKSHSAAYAKVAYQTAYLKTHYPLEFMASLLTSEMDNTDKVIIYINECREKGIKILPPDINESFTNFSVLEEGIRFGLAAVKNVGRSAVECILKIRKKYKKFSSLLNFCEHVDLRTVNKKVMESLIKCGAFDSTGMRRSQMMKDLDKIIEYAQKRQKDRATGQISLFGSNSDSKALNRPLDFSSPDVEEWHEKELLSYEKEALGFYITGHPLASYERYLKRFTSVNSQNITEHQNEHVSIGGIVSQKKEKITKRGDRMAFVQLEDLYGYIEVIVFPDLYKNTIHYLEGEEPVIIKGDTETKDSDAKIIAKEILPLHNTNGGLNGKMNINLHTTGLEKDDLLKLRDIFNKNKGESSVLMHFIFPDKHRISLSVDRTFSIAPTDLLISQVEDIVGRDNVYFDKI